MSTYTPEELEIVDYIEKDEPKSISGLKDKIAEYQQIAKAQINRKRAINIRLLEDDIERIKAKAVREGIPYQTLISSVIHRYATEG